MISQEELKRLLSYDPETGKFHWLVKTCRKVVVGHEAGSFTDQAYVRISIDNKSYKAHRLAFLYMTGSMPKLVDHKDRLPWNNSWSNLKASNKSMNAINSYRSDRARNGK